MRESVIGNEIKTSALNETMLGVNSQRDREQNVAFGISPREQTPTLRKNILELFSLFKLNHTEESGLFSTKFPA